MNREAWLTKAVEEMRKWLDHEGYKLNAVSVSVGWPSKRGLGVKGRRRVGECWHGEAAADGNPQVFISPLISEATEVLHTLLHELIHAVGINGHGKSFRKAAEKMGLEGPMAGTVAGAELLVRLGVLIENLGEFPHAALTPNANERKQNTRLLKVSCGPCDYVCRITRKPLDLYGAPICPNCTIQMLEE